MLIPIGRAGAEAPRKTWLCYTIVGINIWIFLMTAAMTVSVEKHDRKIEESWLASMRYLSAHPYLHVAAELKPLVPRTLEAKLDERGERPEAATVTEEQQELDRLAGPLIELWQQLPSARFGFIPARWSYPRMLSSIFIHSSLMHLFGNMVFLLATGPFVEEAFGWKIFGFVYFGGGFVSTAIWGLRHGDSFTPLVGASGAIAAVMGAYFVRFFKSRIEFWFVPILLLWRWRYRFALPAFVVLPLWFAYQFLWMRYFEAGGGVAFAVHVAGFLYGAGVAFLLILLMPEKGIDRSETDAAILASYERACAQSRWAIADGYANRLLDRTLAERPEKTVEVIRRICSRPSTLPRFLNRAVGIAERSGDRDLAVWLHERIVAVEPSTSSAMRSNFRLGVLRKQVGDVDGAREALMAAKANAACPDDMRMAIDARLAEL